jgi:pyruvate-formate lyase
MNSISVERELGYLLDFTKLYQNTKDKYLREAYALKLQTKHILVPMQSDELVVGSVKHGVIGLSPQYGGLYTYYFNEEKVTELLEQYREQQADAEEIEAAIAYWKEENTLHKLNLRFSQKHSNLDYYSKIGGMIGKDSRIGAISTPTGRLALTIPDMDKLIQLGIPGLRAELLAKNTDSTFIKALLIAVDTIEDAIAIYEEQVIELLEEQPDNENLKTLAKTLSNIKSHKPETFIEGLQLYWIYAVLSDLMNHGRMDVYLGDLYVRDLESGRIDEEKAISYLTDLYRQFKVIGKVHDTRVIIGGKGRRNESNADKLAMLLMETSRRVKEVVPQLTLRYYTGMNEELFDKALQVNAEGCSFPLLYSDDTNIPAVAQSLGVTEEEAQTYIPAGCGEYVLEARSIGTPNSAINILKALELALHHGMDCYLDKIAGPDCGNVEDFLQFEDLWSALTKQIDYAIPIVAWAQKDCYDLIQENAAYLHLSLLMKDCLDKELAMFDGGVRYLNGSTEIMGMISAADSLTAIKKLVYDDKTMTLKKLVEILDVNFEGYEKERQIMLRCPKYGNDDAYADDIAMRLFNYIAIRCLEFSNVIGINRFHMVSVNNSESAVWGTYTMASACGRKNGEAMANANGASIGGDKSGITALLNSMSKFDHSIHCGAINNIRLTKDLFNNSYDKVKLLLKTFFMNNGNQLNLMVMGKEDLINARNNPEAYQNLIIRIGGFSARFVELDPIVQEELILRTTYEVG